MCHAPNSFLNRKAFNKIRPNIIFLFIKNHNIWKLNYLRQNCIPRRQEPQDGCKDARALLQYKYFYKKSIFWANILRQITIKTAFQNTPNPDSFTKISI